MLPAAHPIAIESELGFIVLYEERADDCAVPSALPRTDPATKLLLPVAWDSLEPMIPLPLYIFTVFNRRQMYDTIKRRGIGIPRLSISI